MEISLAVELDKLTEYEHKQLNKWGRYFRSGRQEKDTAAFRLYQITDSSKNTYGYAVNIKKLTISSLPSHCRLSLKMYLQNSKTHIDSSSPLVNAIYEEVVKAGSRRELAKAILDVLGAPDELYDKIKEDKNPVSAYVSTFNKHKYNDTDSIYESLSINKNYW